MTRLLLTIAARRVRQPFNLILIAALTSITVIALAAMSITNALSAQGARSELRDAAGPGGVQAVSQRVVVEGTVFTLVALWDVDEMAATFGIDSALLPAAGSSKVSAALASRMQSRGGETLRARVPGRIVPEVIEGGLAEKLLLDPDELVAFASLSGAVQPPDHLSGGGGGRSGERTIMVILVSLLAIPAVSMVFVAARFDGRRRARVFIELRQLGAGSRQLRVLAAGEAACVSLAAVAVGWGLWSPVRPLVAASGVTGRTFFLSDFHLGLFEGLVVASAVLGVSVSAALAALGKSSAADPAPTKARRRRRAAGSVLALGVIGLHLTAGVASRIPEAVLATLEVVFLGLGALGVFLLGPSLMEWFGRRLASRRRGRLSDLVAGRRLAAYGVQSFRAAGGIVLLAFVFGGFAALDLSAPAPAVDGADVGEGSPVAPQPAESSLLVVDLNGHPATGLIDGLRAAGMTPAPLAYRRVEHASLVALSTCDDLFAALAADFSSPCRPGSAYRTTQADHRTVGSEIALGADGPATLPAVQVAGVVSLADYDDFLDGLDAVIALHPSDLAAMLPQRVVVPVDSDTDQIRVYETVAAWSPVAYVTVFGEPAPPDDNLNQVSTAGRSALLGALLLAGAALAVAGADAAIRRQETSALLYAIGIGRLDRLRITSIEVGLPLLVATLPAVLLGFEQVFVSGLILGGEVKVPWQDLLVATVGSLLMAFLAVALASAFVARLPTRSILQAER